MVNNLGIGVVVVASYIPKLFSKKIIIIKDRGFKRWNGVALLFLCVRRDDDNLNVYRLGTKGFSPCHHTLLHSVKLYLFRKKGADRGTDYNNFNATEVSVLISVRNIRSRN